ncbi:obscurin-like [Anthonomus grandis grandis]|uniref:obscurin-like n=1 Tax=Anthonomus grandis grandis TaxID=2921223 RepID=UPI002165A6A4|nr:obscurin-like [Anthonomus grandis grandis]
MSHVDLLKEANKKKDGDQLFKPEENFQALMGDDEDTVAFVFQHISSEDHLMTSVARTTRGILSFGAIVKGEIDHQSDISLDSSDISERKPFRHWKPSLVVEKTEVVCNEGDQAMLQVQINGYPRPDMRCTFQDVPIKPSSKYKIYHENHEHILLLVIKDVQFEDAGIYTIMAENEIGFDSVDINLKVIRQKYPVLKSKIEDLSISVDEILIVPVIVDGIPTPEVEFLKEGKPILQNDHIQVVENYPTFTLVLKDTNLKDTGVYSVIATNCLAQVSQFWGVYVYSKPRFLQKLGCDQIVSQNVTVTLKAKIEAEPRAAIKWYKDNLQLVNSRKILIDDEEGFYILKIRNVGIHDAGLYTFRASNAHGVCEDTVSIFVKKAPTIVESFDDALVLEQDVFHIIHNVEFTIKLEVFPKPEVKWYLDGDEILDKIPEFTRIQTDDTIKLIVNEPTTELSGEYLCRITNECGQAEASGRLTVNCSPRLMVSLNDLTIEEHFTMTLEVVVRGYPSPRFKWFRNNQEMEPDDRIQLGMEAYGKKKYKIFCNIYDICYAERGEYEVMVENNFGSLKSKCLVNVLTKPIILEAAMRDAVIKEGDDVTYNVRAFGNPAPEVTWLWEGTTINPADKKDWNKIITSHNLNEFRLGIRRARMVDAGVYQCVLENCVGTVRHRVALAVLRRKNDDL